MTFWLLTLNAGSSSLKFALFETNGEAAQLRLTGQVEALGVAPHLTVRDGEGDKLDDRMPDAQTVNDHATALNCILGEIEKHFPQAQISAVGHRVVHGGPTYAAPMVLTESVIDALTAFSPLAPLHQPHNLAGIRVARQTFPDAVQVACFDTAFHRTHPWVNDTFALPRYLYDKGVRRYGFHGLSYEYVTDYMRTAAPEAGSGRLVVAHLGNGASMCAIRNGTSVGSTMGFSALDGLPMGTRPGQLDPGVLLYLMDHENMQVKEISDLLYKESGLKGLSGLSGDMRVLEAAGTPEAQQAIEYFVGRVRREIGAMAAILDGIDALVFCGGIGENAASIRDRVCAPLGWLGLDLDADRNRDGAFVISTPASRLKAYVVRTNEEAVIARHTLRLAQKAMASGLSLLRAS
jgi:acetate kinase